VMEVRAGEVEADVSKLLDQLDEQIAMP